MSLTIKLTQSSKPKMMRVRSEDAKGMHNFIGCLAFGQAQALADSSDLLFPKEWLPEVLAEAKKQDVIIEFPPSRFGSLEEDARKPVTLATLK